MVLAARGLREREDNKAYERIPQEFLLAVQRQARKVWVQSIVATVVIAVVALLVAFLRHRS